MKRFIDILGAVFGLVLFSPLMAFIWLVVVFEDGLPGIFRQRRVGRGRRTFILYKFRTMTIQEGAEHGSFDAGSSARVTRVGRLLRKAKLDELPQLWNVLTGDMSLVGPRPEVHRWLDIYPERWGTVLTVRPGVTDPASIEFRNEEEILARSSNPEQTYRDEILPRKLALYEEYVATRCFRSDVVTLFKTVIAVIAG